jgi:uncharacterized repeat protein (TIGR01451 family)
MTLGLGEQVTCTITNDDQLAQIKIEKSNDKTEGANKGDIVNYTLVISNTGDSLISNIDVVDVLPFGFTYVAGSSEVDGNPVPDPTENSGKYTWNLNKSLLPDESFTLTYQTEIDNDIQEAVYTNIATCYGVVGAYEVDGQDGEVDVQREDIECNVATSDVPIGEGFDLSRDVGGQVLGTSTVLPATGNETNVLYAIILMFITGVGMKLASIRLGKEEVKK